MSTIEELSLKFKSGNSVPVERVSLSRSEWESVVSEHGNMLEANAEIHGDYQMMEQERDLLRACLEHVVNVYLVDDYYGAEDRETLIKRYIDRLMAEQRDKMSEGKNHE